MRRDWFYGLWTDAWHFAARHHVRFTLTLLAAGVVCVVGFWQAFSRPHIGYADIEGYNIVLLIVGERDFFSYFFVRFFTLMAIVGIMLVGSFHPLLARLSVAVILFYSYLCAKLLSTLFILLKLSVLLVSLLCLIPCFFLTLIVLTFLFASVVCIAGSRPPYGCFSDFYCEIKTPLWLCLCAFFLLSLLESLLANFLVIGILL